MNRLLIACGCVLVWAAPVCAQNTSTTQMQLVNSAQFTNRLQYLIVQQAQMVLTEPANDASNVDTFARYTAGCHTLRTNYAIQVIGNPGLMASGASVLIAGGNFSGGVIVGTVTGTGSTADSSANDTALAKAITDSWNTLAKCVANP